LRVSLKIYRFVRLERGRKPTNVSLVGAWYLHLACQGRFGASATRT